MSALNELIRAIPVPDGEVAHQTQRLLDVKTKPRGSLGELEALARRVAVMRGQPAPGLLHKAVVVMGADHGVAAEGVSAYPQAVTRQMLLNFAGGGAAINVLARQVDARVVVADMGVLEPLEDVPSVRNLRVGPGTRNVAREAAMTRQQAEQALLAGAALAEELITDGAGILALGEMGIANTTAASALTAAFTGAPVESVTGRGTGVDEAGLKRKREVVEKALALHRPHPDAPLEVLAALGGFEIAGLAGVALGAARARVPVMLDGFISSVAGLVAARIAPAARHYLLASHRSVEGGHGFVLDALGLESLFDLQLRLGEGTGAVLALQWVDSALRVLHEMSTFEDAGVSDSGA